MKKATQYIFWTGIVFLFVTVPLVHAQVTAGPCPGEVLGGLRNPLRNICGFEEFVRLLLQAVIAIGTPIAVLFIVYSGFLFVTAQGSEDKLKKAKDTFFYTIIGVAIFLSSWALATIVQNTIISITG